MYKNKKHVIMNRYKLKDEVIDNGENENEKSKRENGT